MGVSITELEKAFTALKAALAAPKNDISRDATIQRFEFVVELAWKTSRKVMGTQTAAPKDVIREMARNDLISNPEIWFEALEMRNLSSHTYNESQAETVYSFAGSFVFAADQLIVKLKSK